VLISFVCLRLCVFVTFEFMTVCSIVIMYILKSGPQLDVIYHATELFVLYCPLKCSVVVDYGSSCSVVLVHFVFTRCVGEIV